MRSFGMSLIISLLLLIIIIISLNITADVVSQAPLGLNIDMSGFDYVSSIDYASSPLITLTVLLRQFIQYNLWTFFSIVPLIQLIIIWLNRRFVQYL
ncbi:hypothetical protein ACTQ5R_08355 [Ruoffia tabacinasalis]|uniref:hypothetical protein n=1 Tax=Ruoffia tabacinasalis TaxID=87458 RepID=UPI003F96BDE1